MNMEFYRKLPIPMQIKEEFPLSDEFIQKKKIYDAEIKDILSGKSNKLLLVIGPCSADREEPVIHYSSYLYKQAPYNRSRL